MAEQPKIYSEQVESTQLSPLLEPPLIGTSIWNQLLKQQFSINVEYVIIFPGDNHGKCLISASPVPSSHLVTTGTMLSSEILDFELNDNYFSKCTFLNISYLCCFKYYLTFPNHVLAKQQIQIIDNKKQLAFKMYFLKFSVCCSSCLKTLTLKFYPFVLLRTIRTSALQNYSSKRNYMELEKQL